MMPSPESHRPRRFAPVAPLRKPSYSAMSSAPSCESNAVVQRAARQVAREVKDGRVQVRQHARRRARGITLQRDGTQVLGETHAGVTRFARLRSPDLVQVEVQAGLAVVGGDEAGRIVRIRTRAETLPTLLGTVVLAVAQRVRSAHVDGLGAATIVAVDHEHAGEAGAAVAARLPHVRKDVHRATSGRRRSRAGPPDPARTRCVVSNRRANVRRRLDRGATDEVLDVRSRREPAVGQDLRAFLRRARDRAVDGRRRARAVDVRLVGGAVRDRRGSRRCARCRAWRSSDRSRGACPSTPA